MPNKQNNNLENEKNIDDKIDEILEKEFKKLQ